MLVLNGLSEKLNSDVDKAAKRIIAAKDILIVAHIDADGITSASIAARTCERLGKNYEVRFAKKMSEDLIDDINRDERFLVWIVDLGSGYLSCYTRNNIVITDHHVPDLKWRRGQTLLDGFQDICQINPHSYGLDGSVDISGAGTTYLVSRAVDPRNIDLAYLAIIGACGDLQDSNDSCLVGLNRLIFKDATVNGDMIAEDDLRLFGRESRPLIQFLQYSNDIMLPGLTDNSVGCAKLFSNLSIDLKKGNKLKVWNDLSVDEKKRITDALLSIVDPKDSDRLFGEVYTLPNMTRENGLRDSKEFATILNSCGRYDDAETGMRICLGDDTAMNDAVDNRTEHRHNISAALTYVRQNDLVKTRKYIQYFDAGTKIRDTVVGVVAGMILNTNGFRRDLPIIAFADADDGVKVSARADRSLAERGLNLSEIMTTASKLVGGYGGGHNVAAGATIPKGKENDFLDIVEEMVSSQVI